MTILVMLVVGLDIVMPRGARQPPTGTVTDKALQLGDGDQVHPRISGRPVPEVSSLRAVLPISQFDGEHRQHPIDCDARMALPTRLEIISVLSCLYENLP